MFGFYALAGKATTFLAPLFVVWVTRCTDSQRIGMSVITLYSPLAKIALVRVPELGRAAKLAEV
jgi:MFS transporter, UMF1 family